MKQYIEQHN